MYSSEIKIRVPYSDTDKMGVVYHANYASYFERARTEGLREIGLVYKELEDSGIILPVLDLKITYKKSAYYDDLLTIKASIVELPAVKLMHTYEVLNQQGELLSTGSTTLVFTDAVKMKPTRAPLEFRDKLMPFFK